MDIRVNPETGFPKAFNDTPDEVNLLIALSNLIKVRNRASFSHLSTPRTYNPEKAAKEIAAATETAAIHFRKFIPGNASFDGFKVAYHGNRAVRFKNILWVLFEADPILGTPMTIRPVLETAMCRVSLTAEGEAVVGELGDPDAGVEPIKDETPGPIPSHPEPLAI